MQIFLLEYSKVTSLNKLVTKEDYLILIDLVSGLVPAPGLSSCSTLILKEKKKVPKRPRIKRVIKGILGGHLWMRAGRKQN